MTRPKVPPGTTLHPQILPVGPSNIRLVQSNDSAQPKPVRAASDVSKRSVFSVYMLVPVGIPSELPFRHYREPYRPLYTVTACCCTVARTEAYCSAIIWSLVTCNCELDLYTTSRLSSASCLTLMLSTASGDPLRTICSRYHHLYKAAWPSTLFYCNQALYCLQCKSLDPLAFSLIPPLPECCC